MAAQKIATHRAGVDAAVQLGNTRALMRMIPQLGVALMMIGDLDEPAEAFTESYQCAVTVGDPVGAQSGLE